MTKKERVLEVIAGRDRDHVPAAFFLHFDRSFHKGRAAVEKHMEFFRHTGMDFVKIQYEHRYPAMEILRPEDWEQVEPLGEDYFRDPLDVVEGLVREAVGEALVVVTLYSPFMCAGQVAGRETLVRHLHENPEATGEGLQAVTESVLTFVRGCIERGVDGFYASSQGAEQGLFGDRRIFEEIIKPSDLKVWRLIDEACRFNILHVCDYHGRYAGLDQHLNYPGQVVNCGLELAEGSLTPREVSRMFGRPFMGGMDRHGVLASGPPDRIRAEVLRLIADRPEGFLLGADCTVPADTSWDNLRIAIETAHGVG
jgi:uroporphyrinogen decarboxylase